MECSTCLGNTEGDLHLILPHISCLSTRPSIPNQREPFARSVHQARSDDLLAKRRIDRLAPARLTPESNR